MEALSKAIGEKEQKAQKDEVREALREVKEEAMKRPELVHPDVLHQKLVRLDDVARRAGSPDREKYSLVLSRFSYYRTLPNLGYMVLDALSSKEEAALFDKERKHLKKMASSQSLMQNTHNQANPYQMVSTGTPAPAQMYAPQAVSSQVATQQVFSSPMAPTQMFSPQMAPMQVLSPQVTHMIPNQMAAPLMGPQQGQFMEHPDQYGQSWGQWSPARGPRTKGTGRPTNLKCFKCKRVGHLIRDCPVK